MRVTSSEQSRRADVRHAAKGGGTNLLAVIAGLALPAYHAVVARFFGKALYGAYSVAVGLLEIVARFAMLGMDKGVLRHIAAHRAVGEDDLLRRTLSTAFWATAATGAALAALMALLAAPLAALQENPSIVRPLRLLAPSAPFTALIAVLISATMAAKVMRFNLYVRGLGQPLLLMAAAIIASHFSRSLLALCASHLIATAITAVWAFVVTARVFDQGSFWQQLRQGPPHWEMVRFSMPMGLSEALNGVLQRADLIILSFYADESVVGVYAAAELLSRSVSNARYAFDPVASPVLSEALAQGDRARLSYNLKLMTRWVLLLTFPVVAFIVGFRVELLSLFGKGFSSGAAAFLILVLGHVFNCSLGLVGWVLGMAGRSDLILLNNALSAALNIAVCLFTVPRFGLIGAALASAVSVAFYQLLQLLLVVRLQRVQPFSSLGLRLVAIGSATICLMYFVAPRLPENLVMRLVVGTVIMLTAYGAAVLLFGLGREERQAIDKWRNRRNQDR
ncbi:MAG: oligosaccharide flippase family protein [Deltaproteobacteria bacterium]|nr:oligosaccharide flippase family protein [Deltaproteobacteria bacterium]